MKNQSRNEAKCEKMKYVSKLGWLLISGAAAAVFAGHAAAEKAPLPRAKPAQSQGTTDSPPPLEASRDFETCLKALKEKGVEFTLTAPISAKVEGCGIGSPVRLSSVLRAGDQSAGGKISLPGNPALNCVFALQLVKWVSIVAAPLILVHTGSALKAVSTGPGYQCRRRNRAKTGKLSEHATGNAIDVTGFKTIEKKLIAVSKRASGSKSEQQFLTALGMTACGYFSTVLGPGSNAAHVTHFHFDHAKRGKDWNYRLCE
jgi:hypothetical protein